MSDQRKMRLTLTMVAIILFGLGMWLLWPMIGWRGNHWARADTLEQQP